MKNLVSLILIIIFSSQTIAQEYNITPLLKQLESGEYLSVKKEVQRLLVRNAGDPSLQFLDALLTENGEAASKKFLGLVDKYPQSKYADASIFRLYSYNYAIGSYQTASKFFERLKAEYPTSPYLKSAFQNVSLLSDEDELEQSPNVSVPETKKIAPQKEVYKYTIQAGAFSVLTNAEKLKLDFEKNNYQVSIKEKNVAGASFYIVLVGQFATDSDARTELNEIFNKFNISGRVVPIEI